MLENPVDRPNQAGALAQDSDRPLVHYEQVGVRRDANIGIVGMAACGRLTVTCRDTSHMGSMVIRVARAYDRLAAPSLVDLVLAVDHAEWVLPGKHDWPGSFSGLNV